MNHSNTFRRILAGALAAALLCVLLSAAFAKTGDLRANTGLRHETCTSLSAQAKEYYSDDRQLNRLCSLAGVNSPNDSWAASQNNPLYSALRQLMSETQTKSVDYQSLPNYWTKTDTAANAGSYLYFYGDTDAKNSGFQMNREHIWCKSNASFYQLGGGCDLHHLRPSISFVNAAKSYYTFGYVKGRCSDSAAVTVNGSEVCWASKSKTMFEVKDDVKGDVARILLYVYVRWAQPNLYSNVASSKLPPKDSDDDLNYGQKVVESLDVLLEWMELDPVDTWEMGRNDRCENVQGNRNVFIDCPELAWLMFGREVPDGMKTPSGYAENGIPGYCPAAGYSDVPPEGNWAHAGIDFAVSRGIMGSTSTGQLTFEPMTPCTRSMIVSVLYRLSGSPDVAYEAVFSDVPEKTWFSGAVIWAYRSGVVSGYGTGLFGPNDLVTREQLAVILKGYTEKLLHKATGARANIADFPDEDKATWSRDAVRWAVAEKLISGKTAGGETLLDPQGKASRAEVAAILMRFIQNIAEP